MGRRRGGARSGRAVLDLDGASGRPPARDAAAGGVARGRAPLLHRRRRAEGRNLARNAQCVLTTGTNAWKHGLDVVVEGTAVRVADDARLRQLAGLWASKYHGDWQFDVANGAFHHGAGEALVFEVAPVKVLAFAKGDFAQTGYRF